MKYKEKDWSKKKKNDTLFFLLGQTYVKKSVVNVI